ncbi:MAG: NAD(P)/FAD-dependent oxidoreductase [Candidatus Diapherotrites archaeon]|nr:NAD(P)/FAD-dependent oxidoreductase [Candidatus Diapherotrites archaeon]
MNDYQSIILGAGPAGCFTALKLSEKGIKTALIEEHSEIGSPVHCGECLSEFAVKNLKIELPEKVISKNVKGIKVIFPNGKEFFTHENGYVLEKDLFEKWIAEKAEKKGTEIFLNTRVNGIEKKEKGIELKTNKHSYTADFLIDGSGVSQVSSRLLGLNKPSETVIGMQYLMEEIPNEGWLEFYLWPDLAPEGYLWIIPKKDGKANVGLTTTNKNQAKKLLDKFIEEKKLGNKIVKSFGGLIPHSGPLEKTFDERILLIGDAAGFTSPMFEGGSQLAMKSAEFASVIGFEAVHNNNYSKEFFSAYQRMWKKEFPPYEKLLKAKKEFYSLSSNELNKFSEDLPYNLSSLTKKEKAIYGLKLALKHPHLMPKIKMYDSFKYSLSKFYGW